MLQTLRKPAFLKIYFIPLIQMCLGTMTNSIAILFALDLGATILQLNIINTMRSTMAILLLVPFGILSDRWGRKPMVLYPRVIMFVGTLIRVFATTPTHLIMASVVGGFAGGSFFPVLLSMIADIATEEEQREGISTLFVFSSIGMVVGPSITAYLLLFNQITFRTIYQVSAVAEVLTLSYLAIVIKETKPPERKGKTEFLPQAKQLFGQTSFQGLLVVSLLYMVYQSIFRTYAPIYGRMDLNLTDSQIVSFSTYQNLGVMLIRISSATFLAWVPISLFLLAVLVLGGTTSFLVTLATNYTFMALLFFLVGLSFGAYRILSTTLVADYSVPENRGLANSLLNLSQSSGNFVTIFTSSMAENLGLHSVFMLSSVACLSAIFPTIRAKLGR